MTSHNEDEQRDGKEMGGDCASSLVVIMYHWRHDYRQMDDEVTQQQEENSRHCWQQLYDHHRQWKVSTGCMAYNASWR